MAPLNLVPRIAADTVVAVADRFHDGQALRDHTSIYKVSGYRVLDACPDLISINQRKCRTPSVRPGAHQQTLLVIDCVYPLCVLVIPEFLSKVVPIDGLQGFFNAFRLQSYIEIQYVGVP